MMRKANDPFKEQDNFERCLKKSGSGPELMFTESFSLR